jgi:hypothetical protein
MHAERIASKQFWEFTWKRRKELVQYLRWAGEMAKK